MTFPISRVSSSYLRFRASAASTSDFTGLSIKQVTGFVFFVNVDIDLCQGFAKPLFYAFALLDLKGISPEFFVIIDEVNLVGFFFGYGLNEAHTGFTLRGTVVGWSADIAQFQVVN